nr:glycosyltransferase family 2 protein [uncultured Bacteroides sp.]
MKNESGIKVSIIVAIYNSEKFLEKLILSIINQTYKNIEVILVDDGSPDNSGAICDKYAAIDSRIKVLHKPNGGCCDARNKGLELVTGEFLTIIDGDDWLEPDYVEYLMELVLQTDSDMGMSLNIFTTREHVQVKCDKIETWTSEDAAIAIIYPKLPIGPWNKIYKTDMIRRNNIDFSVPWSGEGHYFSAMAAQYSNHVGVGHRKVYNYRLNNTGSGLTHYNVIMGINALWNTKNMGEKLVVRTKRLEHAIDYHIWSNYHFILKLIIATNSKNKYIEQYKECLVKVRTLLPGVIWKSEVSFKHKVKMLLISLFPIPYARFCISREQAALQKDKLK